MLEPAHGAAVAVGRGMEIWILETDCASPDLVEFALAVLPGPNLGPAARLARYHANWEFRSHREYFSFR